MAKKLFICNDKSCKNAGTYKIIKGWAKKLKIDYSIKKSKCLGKCKETYAVKFKGEIFSCQSKKELEKIIDG
jgi:NADH:ubiquinone oxidoreductase subunit E